MGILTLKDITYTYKTGYHNVNAVNGISFIFEAGRFYAIMGRSGSGKTTLLSLIAGLDNPTSGELYFGEKKVSEINRDRYRLEHVSVIYQSLNLFPLLTAMENVMFPLEYRKVPKAEAISKAKEKLASVGIGDGMFKRQPSMLSGGEQQRVAIARALAANTEIILADEPTGNLDTENSTNIIKLLKELAASEGVCVIVVTHDPGVAEQADVILRIKDGRLQGDDE